MTGRVEGKVAFITGAGRGQGRSHAIRLAQEGANIIAVDICSDIETVPYGLATDEDLAQTVKEVEATGQKIVASHVDVRDYDALKKALDEGVEAFGRLDIVSANAGIDTNGVAHELSDTAWDNVVDTNLKGVWHTTKAATPHFIASGAGGAMTLTSSCGGVKGFANKAHYIAAKHGVIGLMRTLAIELAPYKVRVNAIVPTAVDTALIQYEDMYKLFRPDLEHPTQADAEVGFRSIHLLDIPWIDPVDVSNALLFLSSDEARYITGITLPVDGGFLTK